MDEVDKRDLGQKIDDCFPRNMDYQSGRENVYIDPQRLRDALLNLLDLIDEVDKGL